MERVLSAKWAIAPFLMLAATAALSSAASPACDQSCVAITRILADRVNGFRNLKGSQVDGAGTAWRTSVTLLNLECRISNNDPPISNSFGCFADRPLGKEAAEKVRDDILSAFRDSAPNWKWFSWGGSDKALVTGGPARNELFAHIYCEPMPDPDDGKAVIYAVGFMIWVEPERSSRQDLEPM